MTELFQGGKVQATIENQISDYLKAIKAAGNEEVKRQRFVALLQSLFGSMEGAKPIIEEFVGGAETVVSKIERAGKKSDKGRADTQYRSVIIEFENDLAKTGEHAKDQLADYVSGNWNSGSQYLFTLISSDCITWKTYTPDVDEVPSGKAISASSVVLKEKDSFTVTETNGLDFYYFLDALLFQTEKKRPSLEAIKRDFGDGSNAFITATDQLTIYFEGAKASGEITVAYEQWKRFLSVAYDKFDSSERVFLIHTYLSVFAKMLTYEILTKDDFIDDDDITGILTGEIFDKLNVRNFTDNDFFHWVAKDEARKALRPMFRAISTEFDAYDFGHIDEDILKGVYQDLIDRDTRHSLGEYYTPDWLCETIVGELKLESSSRVLDPSCGSGSFLRTTIDKFNADFPNMTADQIASQVSGLDIHPLSVQISKATALIALKDKVAKSPKPVFLSVFLANTLLSPTGTASLNLFGDTFDIWIDNKKVAINTNIFNDPLRFEKSVHAAEKIADFTKGDADMSASKFAKALGGQGVTASNDFFANSIYDIYKAFKGVKEAGRDSIWEFIVLNLYKPCFFHRSFDFIVGNPPWFTFASIGNANYQDLLRAKAKATGTWPKKQANAPHMEIAAIFLAHCTDYFLKDKGKLAFVLPRSFFQADHHDNTRSGAAKFVRIKEIWDLDKVSPLFNVPSCVIFAERAHGSISTSIPKSGCSGKLVSGKLKKHNANLAEVKDKLSFKAAKFYYSKLGQKSAFTTKKLGASTQTNHYKKLFRQGATLVPRNFYFIEPTQKVDGTFTGKSFAAKTSDASNTQAKEPWKDIIVSGRLSSDYLFRTALAQNVLPFALHKPLLVLLPAKLGKSGKLIMQSSQDVLEDGALDTAKWFKNVESHWLSERTERSKNMSNLGRLDYGKGLTSQDFDMPYVVLYTTSGKDANSVVIRRADHDLPFAVDHKTYMYACKSENEAHYLSAFLNSEYPNEVIKDFQSRGLFGPRDIHKTILDVALPKFDPNNATHTAIAEVDKVCHEKAKAYLDAEKPDANLPAHALGRHRLALRKLLSAELGQIDTLFKSL